MKEGVIFNAMLGVSMGWMHRGHPATTVPTVPQEDSTMQTIPIQSDHNTSPSCDQTSPGGS